MIPAWNISAVLPPIRPNAVSNSFDRSPYSASLSNVVERFGTSVERRAILRGLLSYRAALRAAGIVAGFQWLNGSFVENKELLTGYPPNDVDVVTFFDLPPETNEATFITQAGELFDSIKTKAQFHVDAYPFRIGKILSLAEVRQISYWYSMWSHRRNQLWKGFVQVDMAANEDDLARAVLDQLEQETLKK
jgi:hypothetical protein